MRARRLFQFRDQPSRDEPRVRRCRVPVASGLAVAIALGCAGGVPLPPEVSSAPSQNSEVYARANLEKARALRAEGRLEAAARVARRGLEQQPENAQLHRLRAALLEELGQPDAAAVHRSRAEELAPRPPPLSDAPHELAERAVRPALLLLPPSPEALAWSGSAQRVPQNWPDGPEAQLLARRVATRLPNATVTIVSGPDHPTSRSVQDARSFLSGEASDAAISLRLDRAFCGSSLKDGGFGVAWLRVAAARPSHDPALDAPHLVRVALENPPSEGCEAEAVARSFERALELRAVRHALAAEPVRHDDEARYTTAAIRRLFPELGRRQREAITEGRRQLAVGDLARALDSFERAATIDPDDSAAAVLLDDARRSLALARLLAPGEGTAVSSRSTAAAVPHEPLDAQLSRSQRLGMEAQLEYESRRREEMLSALAVLYEMRNAPTPGTVANMRQAELPDPSATGIALTLPRLPHGTAVEVRTLFAPDGSVLARYYFADDSQTPILQEEDRDANGRADRWVGYQDGLIKEVWERNGDGNGPPTLHIVYSPGGSLVERIELDPDGDGELDHVFVYAAGRLREESSDTDGDGAFDRFQHFDAHGSLTIREEDIDGDEEIDVRTRYADGRIVRREILNPELLDTERGSEYQ